MEIKMTLQERLRIYIGVSLALGGATVMAATIVNAKATPSVANQFVDGTYATATAPQLGENLTPPPAGPGKTNIEFGIQYFNNEAFGCGARIADSEGYSKNIEIKKPQVSVFHVQALKRPGNYSITLSGYAHSGLVACLGSQTANVRVLPTTTDNNGAMAASTAMTPSTQPNLQRSTPGK